MMLNSAVKRSDCTSKKVRFQKTKHAVHNQKGGALRNEVDESLMLIIKGCKTIILDEVSLCNSESVVDMVTKCGLMKQSAVDEYGNTPGNDEDDDGDDQRPKQPTIVNDDENSIRQYYVGLEYQNRGSLHFHAFATPI